MSTIAGLVPIVKVVGNFCNTQCGYCFYHTLDQATPHRMSLHVLERFIREHAELCSGDLSFIWHGGEPTLAGLDFFHDVIRLQREYIAADRKIHNAIQTNGTRITDAWAQFFSAHDFRVGVSLDGAAPSHNRFRVDRAGRGFHADALRGIATLRAHGIEPGIIQTVTETNAAAVTEDVVFFVDTLRLHGFGTNTFLDIDGTNAAMWGEGVSVATQTQLAKRQIALWLAQDDSTLRIREVENLIAGACGTRAPSCSFNGTCRMFYSVEYDGRVFPCDRLSLREDACFGDLTTTPLADILNGERRRAFVAQVETLPARCQACEWQHACHNGCTAHRVGGPGGRYYYCESRQELFGYVRDLLAARAAPAAPAP